MTDIILLGKPGSGKGTWAKKLTEKGYYHLSGSDVLRENSKDKSAKFYKEARHALDTGILIESSIIDGMVIQKLKELKGQKVVFDGYPRSIEQTETLLSQYKKNGKKIKAVYLEIDDSKIIERITNRITCKSCAASFGKVTMKPKQEGVCDHCGGELAQRVDDNEDTLKTRLDQYTEHTFPVIDEIKDAIHFEIIQENEEIKI